MDHLFKDFGKVFIRTPIYSYASLFNKDNETRNLDDLVLLRINDPVFLEALYWSSPQLLEAVLKFKVGGIKGAKEKKLMKTLKKYLIRASTRCTPYGIYAGTGIADIGIEQEAQKPAMERKVRIDMGFMQSLKSAIESDPGVYPHLLYTLNNSLYPIPGQYRFMETVIENGKCHYQLSSIDQTDFLDQIIRITKSKRISGKDIYALADKDTPCEDLAAFVNELIKTQFLVSELELGLTTENELVRYIQILQRIINDGIETAKKYMALLLSLKDILIEFRSLPIGDLPFNQINDLNGYLTECGLNTRHHVFHADLRQTFPGFIFQKEKLKDLEKAICILGKLSCSFSPHEMQIDHFKRLFHERYETQEVPLSKVLDPELGIGFPASERIGDTSYNPLLEKVDLSIKENLKARAENCQIWLKDKIESLDTETLEEEIRLTDEDLKDFDDNIVKLANHFIVMGTVLPSGKILLQNTGGSHANSLFGRFAYLEDKIGKFCKEISDIEKQRNESEMLPNSKLYN